MNFTELLNNKDLKSKEKSARLGKWILSNPEKINDLVKFAGNAKDPIKATCMEAFEFSSKTNPAIASSALLKFVSQSLMEKAPRVKWESAKVIGNIAHLYPGKLKEAVKNLLINADHTGTVVRWSAAFALGEIVKNNTSVNKELIPAIEAICNREEQNSIKKIYREVLKKVAI